MICKVCGTPQQIEGTECLSCRTPFSMEVLEAADSSGDSSSSPSALDLFKQESASPSPSSSTQKGENDPIKKNLEEQAKLIQEQEKQIQLQLAKMEEEKQRLLEIKLTHEKQMQEMKAIEEQKKVEKKASEIVQAVDKFKNILVTSLPSVEKRPILEYKGLIGAHVLIKVDVLEASISGLKDASGLRNTPYYDNLKKGFQIGLTDLKIEASKLQANAVVGVVINEQQLKDQVLMLSFNGMAVVCQTENESPLV